MFKKTPAQRVNRPTCISDVTVTTRLIKKRHFFLQAGGLWEEGDSGNFHKQFTVFQVYLQTFQTIET